MDYNLVHKWMPADDSSVRILDILSRLISEFGPLLVFVRRLPWVPINFPVVIDDEPVSDNTKIFYETSDSPLTIGGYWLPTDDLIHYLKMRDVGSLVIHLFSLTALRWIADLSVFETCVFLSSGLLGEEQTKQILSEEPGIGQLEANYLPIFEDVAGDSMIPWKPKVREEHLESVTPLRFASLPTFHTSKLSVSGTTRGLPISPTALIIDDYLRGNVLEFLPRYHSDSEPTVAAEVSPPLQILVLDQEYKLESIHIRRPRSRQWEIRTEFSSECS